MSKCKLRRMVVKDISIHSHSGSVVSSSRHGDMDSFQVVWFDEG